MKEYCSKWVLAVKENRPCEGQLNQMCDGNKCGRAVGLCCNLVRPHLNYRPHAVNIDAA